MRLPGPVPVAFAALLLAVASCRQGGAPGFSSAPTFRYVKDKEGGCGNLFLYKGSADDREVLWISADREKLKLPEKGIMAFDLAESPAGLRVAIDLWEKVPRFRAYCNDISPDTKKIATWKATRGKLTLTLREPERPTEGGPKHYRAGARLEGVVFEEDGREVKLEEETISETLVGWFAG
jgi:hypothetical protein